MRGLVVGITTVQEGMIYGASVGVGAVLSFNLVNAWLRRKNGDD